MSTNLFRVALITDVFPDDSAGERLHERLWEARCDGAELAILPELPLDSWCPARREPSEDDAEELDGRRHELLSASAKEVGLPLVGGAIVRDASGRRGNTALVYDADGALVGSYRKVHLPFEEGFWETAHYEPGVEPPRPISGLGPSLGVQICSDINRTVGAQLLAAHGVEVVCAPRSTPLSTYARWRLVYQAAAVTGCAYVVSVNRPGPEAGVDIGGPSLVAGPDGTVVEAQDPVTVVSLDLASLGRLRRDYPGYLPFPADVYARGWAEVGQSS